MFHILLIKIKRPKKYFDQALELYPDHPFPLSDKSVLLVNSGEELQALDLSHKAVNQSPNDPYHLAVLSFAEIVNGQTEESTLSVNRALERNPNHSSALIMKSAILLYTGENNEALSYIDRALERNPNHPDVLYLKAVINGNIGAKEETLRVIDEILEINPNHLNAILYKALLLSKSDNHDDDDDVISLVERVDQINPDYAPGFQTLGTIFHYLRDYDTAIEYYDRFLEQNPDDQITINAKQSALKELPYSNFKLHGDPTVCAIEPEPNDEFPTLTPIMFLQTEEALNIW